MRLLLDQNLAPRLVPALAILFPESKHVREVGLATADDAVVWRYAAEEGFPPSFSSRRIRRHRFWH